MIGEYEKMPAQQGWQCPICGRVYSPTTMMCLYCGNEKESISTTCTIDYVHHEWMTKTEGEWSRIWSGANAAIDIIIAVPSAQPEIVRCRDCIAYQEGIDIDGKPFTRCNGSVRTYGHTPPDWYCADAERRTE